MRPCSGRRRQRPNAKTKNIGLGTSSNQPATGLGHGRSAGYAIFIFGTNYAVTPQLQLIAQVNNVFDTRHNTAAQPGTTGFDGSGNFVARPFGGSSADGYALQHATFYAPGAPRLFWVGSGRVGSGRVGLRYAFDKASGG